MKKKFSFAIIFFITGIIVAVFISVSAVRESYRSKTIEQEVENLKLEAQRIQNENDAMTQRIAYFETPQFQEKIAKEKLNLQKIDENVVVVKQGIDQKKQAPEVKGDEIVANQDDPNYQKWWNLFFKY